MSVSYTNDYPKVKRGDGRLDGEDPHDCVRANATETYIRRDRLCLPTPTYEHKRG
jgi:hypothetical protein